MVLAIPPMAQKAARFHSPGEKSGLDRRVSKPRRSPIRGRNCASSGPERALLALSDACESHRFFVPGPISRGFPGPETLRGCPATGADRVFLGGELNRFAVGQRLR